MVFSTFPDTGRMKKEAKMSWRVEVMIILTAIREDQKNG